MPTAYTAGDFATALSALLPSGPAWPRDSNSVQAKLVAGLTGVNERTGAAALDVLVQAFPATSEDLLAEWEASLGLPDVYGIAPGTTAGRQAAVVAALTDVGGQSIAYFVSLAAALGYTITITQFSGYNVNAGMDMAIASDEWASTWQVNGPLADAITYTPTVDIAQAVPDLGIPLLEAVLAKFKPAHTVCITAYS